MTDLANDNLDLDFTEEEERAEDELSYGELYSSALLNGEIIVTIAVEDEEKTKAGIKNYKNKQNIKCRDSGIPLDNSSISFASASSKEFQGCVDLSVIVTRRGTVKVRALRIPENDLPE